MWMPSAASKRETSSRSPSALVSIYKRDSRTGKLQAVTEAEFASGRFIDGGARFAFDDRRPDLEGFRSFAAKLPK